MLGTPNTERLRSLEGCHAIHQRKAVKYIDKPEAFDRTVGAAIKELMLADRDTAVMGGKLNYIVQVEVLL